MPSSCARRLGECAELLERAARKEPRRSWAEPKRRPNLLLEDPVGQEFLDHRSPGNVAPGLRQTLMALGAVSVWVHADGGRDDPVLAAAAVRALRHVAVEKSPETPCPAAAPRPGMGSLALALAEDLRPRTDHRPAARDHRALARTPRGGPPGVLRGRRLPAERGPRQAVKRAVPMDDVRRSWSHRPQSTWR